MASSPPPSLRCLKKTSWRSATSGKRRRWRGFPSRRQEGLIAYYPLDGDLADTSGQHHDGNAVRGDVVYDEGKIGKAAEFSGETQVSFGNIGDFDRGDRFALALWARPSPRAR